MPINTEVVLNAVKNKEDYDCSNKNNLLNVLHTIDRAFFVFNDTFYKNCANPNEENSKNYNLYYAILFNIVSHAANNKFTNVDMIVDNNASANNSETNYNDNDDIDIDIDIDSNDGFDGMGMVGIEIESKDGPINEEEKFKFWIVASIINAINDKILYDASTAKLVAEHENKIISLLNLILPQIKPNLLITSHSPMSNLLWHPILCEYTKVVKLLIAHGVEIDHMSYDGQTPLSIVSNHGQFYKLFMSNHTINHNHYNEILHCMLNSDKFTTVAINKDNSDIKDEILQKAKNDNLSAGYGTALSSAIFHNKIENAKLLLSCGGDINLVIKNNTLLHHAMSEFNAVCNNYIKHKIDRVALNQDTWLTYDEYVDSIFVRLQSMYNYVNNLIQLGANQELVNDNQRKPREMLDQTPLNVFKCKNLEEKAEIKQIAELLRANYIDAATLTLVDEHKSKDVTGMLLAKQGRIKPLKFIKTQEPAIKNIATDMENLTVSASSSASSAKPSFR